VVSCTRCASRTIFKCFRSAAAEMVAWGMVRHALTAFVHGQPLLRANDVGLCKADAFAQATYLTASPPVR
jgi:hypothetical protein